jgi:hypothetical protein
VASKKKPTEGGDSVSVEIGTKRRRKKFPFLKKRKKMRRKKMRRKDIFDDGRFAETCSA